MLFETLILFAFALKKRTLNPANHINNPNFNHLEAQHFEHHVLGNCKETIGSKNEMI